MKFDARHFEQYFSEQVLDNGFRLFRKENVVLLTKEEGVFHFRIRQARLIVNKRGNDVSAWKCSCRINYCLHLAAVMFYFQRDMLGTLNAKNVSPRGSAVTKSRTAKGKGPLLQHYITHLKGMDDAVKNRFYSAVTGLYNQTKREFPGHLFYLQLALIARLSEKLYVSRDEQLEELLREVKTDFSTALKRRSSDVRANALYQSAMDSVKNNQALKSGAFEFLLPRYFIFSGNRVGIESLRSVLFMRKYRVSYDQYYDPLEVVKVQAEMILARKLMIDADAEVNVETVIALSDLYFLKGNADRGFDVLEKAYGKIKSLRGKFPRFLCDLIIKKATEYKLPEKEREYITESFIHDVFITPVKFERFIHLLPLSRRQEEVDLLIKKISTRNYDGADEKLIYIFEHEQRTGELLKFLERPAQRFSLIHSTVLKNQDLVTTRILELYFRHLSQALDEAGNLPHQQSIIQTAVKFLKHLPAELKRSGVEKLLDDRGRYSYLSRRMEDVF